MRQFNAGKNENNMRLSRFVLSVTKNLPNSLLHKSFRNKRIKVNGKKQNADYLLHEGDLVELYINDEFFTAGNTKQISNKKTIDKLAEKANKLNILYEDDNIAAIYKPFHMLCHSDRTKDDNLTDLFRTYLHNKGEYYPDKEQTFAPSICNRLDRGTAGIVIAAKNYTALKHMNEIIRNGLLEKHYLCITFGIPKNAVHTAYLNHNEKNNKVHVIQYEKENYKQIITGVEVIEKKGAFCLCDINLITGRTHQIRAHLAYLNAPVLGDIKYGNRTINSKLGTKTQALSAYCVKFSNNILPENLLYYLKEKIIATNKQDILSIYSNI